MKLFLIGMLIASVAVNPVHATSYRYYDPYSDVSQLHLPSCGKMSFIFHATCWRRIF